MARDTLHKVGVTLLRGIAEEANVSARKGSDLVVRLVELGVAPDLVPAPVTEEQHRLDQGRALTQHPATRLDARKVIIIASAWRVLADRMSTR